MLTRRDWLTLAAAGVVGHSMSGWLGDLAAAAAPAKGRKRACILLWMNGGPSQMETFDPKPGHKNGGPTKEIATSVPGVRLAQNLPGVAKHLGDLAVIRSMTTKEGDHTRATYYLRTGYLPTGSVHFPAMGSVLSKELGDPDSALPNYVSIAASPFLSPQAYGPGFLGAEHAPLMIANNQFGFGGGGRVGDLLRVQNLAPPKEVSAEQFDARLDLTKGMQEEFAVGRAPAVSASHRAAYERAVRLMKTEARKAFDLDGEKDKLRDAYGRNLFGQGCLLARRLVERGVPFVEVTLSGTTAAPAGWDTHDRNFAQVESLCRTLDPAWATLMSDLKERGMLDSTLVVWMGEFGRTPQINRQGGRDHFPNAWSAVLGGGGIKGGQAYGATTKDGMGVDKKPVGVPDLMTTIVRALGLDPKKQNMSNVGRPIRLADPAGKAVEEVLA
ncbi:MAG: DUF1501 domain-containing protein [Gemmataceae bacterium]|nr:DUF1501 domain-containing protein [Gemmataceae bacterium]